jgi:hypothetical protein
MKMVLRHWWKKSISYERFCRYQCVQNATAIRANADCIVTRNKKDFTDSTLPIYTVKELLEIVDMKEADTDLEE